VTLGAGETLLAPKGVPHTYRVESREGARWPVITRRGDFERFVHALSRPAERSRRPPRARDRARRTTARLTPPCRGVSDPERG